MSTFLLLFGIYAIGFYLAYAIAVYHINLYKTKDSPLIPSMLSWLIVIPVVVIYVVKLFAKDKDNEKED